MIHLSLRKDMYIHVSCNVLRDISWGLKHERAKSCCAKVFSFSESCQKDPLRNTQKDRARKTLSERPFRTPSEKP
jgi:hypothetical protein